MTLKLLVEAEYGSSGIWYYGEHHAIGMVEHEEINLPPELSQRFNDWIELYYSRLPAKMRGASDESTPIRLDQFDAIGRELARDLKAFMGPDVIVRYSTEVNYGSEPPELIG